MEVMRVVQQPDLMPYYPKKRALKRGIDLAWGKKQITASVTSSILQGKSIKGMADDLQRRITTMNRDSAIRTARTAVTGAQNAGRMDGYAEAAALGIKVEKRWVAVKDNRTRHDHGMADGQIVPFDKPFLVGGEKLMFPGDRNGSGWNIYNCRCTTVTGNDLSLEAEPTMIRVRDPVTGRNVVVPEMTYQEWAKQKQAENKTAWDTYMKKGKNLSSDKKQWREYREILGKNVPDTLDSFQNMKYNEPEKWGLIKLDKRRRDSLKACPELALPGDKKTAETEKFTKYLFNQDNPHGRAKGTAFSSRLGYTVDNYDAMRREIFAGARRNPVVSKGDNGFGVIYEQKMILYGINGNPANVTVGWIYKDGVARMTTAYISGV